MVDGQHVKIGIIIQARMGSKRLPNKILKNLPYLSQNTIIGNIIRRVQLLELDSKIIVATSKKKENDILISYLNEIGIEYFRGKENNVLSRFIEIQNKEKFDIIVRLTADNPCLDHTLLDKSIDNHIISSADYSITKDYPLGMNFEIFNGYLLNDLVDVETTIEEEEHVTLYFRKRPEQFKLNDIFDDNFDSLSNIRLTVDTEEDYSLQCVLHEKMIENPQFLLEDIICLSKKEPWIFDINKSIQQKNVEHTHKDEINKVISVIENKGFDNVVLMLKNLL